MLLAFKNHLQEHFPEVAEAKILVAVSGGLDSIVLTQLSRKAGLDISLAHCNFNLRGRESDEDEDFVVELADALDLEIFCQSFETETYAAEHKLSVQMAARKLRYEWFEDLRKNLSFDYIFTAHHANDDLETFLINFTRGTGLDGLTGIPFKNGKIRRPLLAFSRQNLEDYARKSGFGWREDSSNESTKYLRNKIRKDVIPQLMEINPQLLENFRKTRKHLQQSAALVEDYTGMVFSQVAQKEDFGYTFSIIKLKSFANLEGVLYELFKSFGFTEWNDVRDLLEAQPGKYILSATHRLVKDRDKILLTLIPSAETKQYEISEEEELLMLPNGCLHLEKVSEEGKSSKNAIFVDKEKLNFPLTVRKWREGDYFFPAGMQGKKKLSKYFKDEKLSLPEKENSWLLCSKNKIVWVIGRRPDARFAANQDNRAVLRISYTS